MYHYRKFTNTFRQCENCCIFKDREIDKNYQISPRAVIQASRKGCDGCLLIEKAVKKGWGTSLNELDDAYLLFESFTSQRLSYRAVRLRRHDVLSHTSSSPTRASELYFAKSPSTSSGYLSRFFQWVEARNPGIPSRLQITSTADSCEAICWARKRLQTCLDSHMHCARPARLATRPKRLIRIGPDGSDPVRVISLPTGSINYTTLSYCWGTSTQKHALQKHNYARYAKEIPGKALLRTFSDAIRFSRALGIGHIWIDAFCIVQDDPADWKEEAEKMCDIYKNSYVTLSALGFSNPDEGLFDQQTDDSLLTKGSNTYFCNKMDENPLDWLEWPNWWSSYNNLPAMSRGWCYQERLLSNRTLHFTRREVYWDCWQEHCCQCTHSDHKFTDASPWQFSVLARQRHSSALISQDHEVLMRRWREVVHEFTSLSLSFPSDRLSAIFGIAMEFQNITKQKYLCGLWEKSILLDLCWNLDLGHGRTRYKIKGRVPGAPSWSWGSVDGPVRYHAGLTESKKSLHVPLCTFEELDLFNPNVHPALTKGRGLLLHGRRTRGRLSFLGGNTNFLLEGRPSLSASVTLDYALWKDYSENPPSDLLLGDFYLFNILCVPEGQHNHGLHYIVLRKITGQKVYPVYERIYPVFERVGHIHRKAHLYSARPWDTWEAHPWDKWIVEHATEGYVLLV